MENSYVIIALVAIFAIGSITVFLPNNISGMITDIGSYQQDPIGDPLINQCDDSDFGDNAFVAGRVTTYRQDTGVVELQDICVDDRNLREHFCLALGNYVRAYSKFVPCPNGCINGACVQ